jgi:chemotaxis protein MotB
MADGSDAEPHGAGHELIIVRRHEEEDHEHHSSAWKVAHADFMTAMMAFFLIMWLISVTDDEVRKGISQYFNPIHMSQGSTDLKGLNTPTPGEDTAAEKGHNDIPLSGDALSLMKMTKGHEDEKKLTPEQAAAALEAAAAAAAKLEAAAGVAEKGEAKAAGEAEKAAAAAAAATAAGASEHEREAFQDPYAVLAKIAAAYAAQDNGTGATIDGDTRQNGVSGGAVERDPFDPAYWQLSPLAEAKSDAPGDSASLEAVPAGAAPDAAASGEQPPGENATAAEAKSATAAKAVEAEGPPQATMPEAPASAPIAAAVEAPAPATPETPPPAAAAQAVEAKQAASAELAAAVAQSVKDVMAKGAGPDLSVSASAEGISISLTDEANYSMFPVGSAVPDAKAVVLLADIAKVLAARPGQIVIRGYTDGRPFHSADYDNWRLSAARAHMAYYMLTRGGLAEARVESIEGHADRSLKNAADPYAAENRRIEILLKEKP